MNKYKARKITVGGQTFDSRKEYRRYCQLKMLEAAKEIDDLRRQVIYQLIPKQYDTYPRYSKNGRRLSDGRRCIERACVYVADFVYTENGQTVVEDVKGMKTKDYIIKRKLMLYVYNIRIKEV